MSFGVQHAVLKMLEVRSQWCHLSAAFSAQPSPAPPFDTTNVLFFCGGVFVGLEDIIVKRLGGGGFGFYQMS
jgi:ATP-dependent Clp protease ATP-binding subunit ClpX